METSHKRKRHINHPRIIYHTSGRTFERLFKEDSLGEMKEVVRKKIGLPSNASISLEQIRDGKPIDLEDDDDFDAFYSIAHSTHFANVRVIVRSPEIQPRSFTPLSLIGSNREEEVDNGATLPMLPVKQRLQGSEGMQFGIEGESAVSCPSDDGPNIRKSQVSAQESHTSEPSGIGYSKPPKKKKKKALDDTPAVGNLSTATSFISPREIASTPRLSSPMADPSYGEASASISVLPPGIDQTTPKTKAKRKNRRKSMVVSTTDQMAPELAAAKKNKKAKEIYSVPFADQLAGSISETSEANGASNIPGRAEKSEGEGIEKQRRQPDNMLVENWDVVPIRPSTSNKGQKVDSTKPEDKMKMNASDAKKLKGKKESTADELESVSAVIQGALSRVLAVKRASLSVSALDASPVHGVNQTDKIHTAVLEGTRPPLKNRSQKVKAKDEVATMTSYSTRHLPSQHVPTSDNTTSIPLSTTDHHPHPQVGRPVFNAGSTAESDDGDETSSDDVSQVNPDPATVPGTMSQYTEVDLDAVIRGPKIALLSAADVLSPEISEEEREEVLDEDEEKPDKRRHRRIHMTDSSDDGDSEAENNSAASVSSINNRHSPPTTTTRPGMDHVSFQDIDRLGESQEVDNSGDVAFGIALAADTSIFKPAGRTECLPNPLSDVLVSGSTSTPKTIQTFQHVDSLEDFSSAGDKSSTQPSAALGEPPMLPKTRHDPVDTDSQNRKPSEPKLRVTSEPAESSNDVVSTGSFMKLSQLSKNSNTKTSKSQESKTYRTRASTRLQTLSSLTQLPIPGYQSRLISASNSTRSIKNSHTALSDSQKSASLDTWTTLKPSSPPPEADSTIMVDELRSSPSSRFDIIAKPTDEASTTGSQENHKSKKKPLFILTESQPPFPYSQWANVTQVEEEGEDDPISNDSDDEIEVEASIQSQSQAKSMNFSKYPRLTDIASQNSSFLTPTNGNLRLTVAGERATDMYGRTGPQDLPSESESESDDSDVQEQSHIPKSRRAGGIRAKR